MSFVPRLCERNTCEYICVLRQHGDMERNKNGSCTSALASLAAIHDLLSLVPLSAGTMRGPKNASVGKGQRALVKQTLRWILNVERSSTAA